MRHRQAERAGTGEAIAGLLALLILMLAPGAAEAVDPRFGTAPFGAGHAWNVGAAGSGAALDTGLRGGPLNPAAYRTDQNEIYGEASIAGAGSRKQGVGSPEPQFGPGMIGYLNTGEEWTFAFGYVPRVLHSRGAEFGVFEVRGEYRLHEYTASLARDLGARSVGVTIAAVRGKVYDGVISPNVPVDTMTTARLWTVRLGVQDRAGEMRWALGVEGPPIGTLDVERPANLGGRRFGTVYSYRGAWSVRGALAWLRPGYELAADLALYQGGFVRLGDDAVADRDLWYDLSASLRFDAGDQVRMVLGAGMGRHEVADGYYQATLGAEYRLEEHVTLVGSAGVMFYHGAGAGNVLDDILPWVLRGGIVYHGD